MSQVASIVRRLVVATLVVVGLRAGEVQAQVPLGGIAPPAPAAAARPDRFFRGFPTTASFLEADPSSVGVSRDALVAIDSIMLAAVRDSVIQHGAVAVGRGGKLVRMRGYGWTQRDSARLATPATTYRVGPVTNATLVTQSLLTQLQMEDSRIDVETSGPPLFSASAFDLAVLADLALRDGIAPMCQPQATSGVPCTRARPASILVLPREVLLGDNLVDVSAGDAGPIWIDRAQNLYVVLLMDRGSHEVEPSVSDPLTALRKAIRDAVQAAVVGPGR